MDHRTAELATRAKAGDPEASALFDVYGHRVGKGAGVLFTIFKPARVVFGGSAARYLPLFAPGLDKALSRVGEFRWNPPYAEAQLGSLSGAIGAAVLVSATPDLLS